MKKWLTIFLLIGLLVSSLSPSRVDAEIISYNVRAPLPIIFVHGYNDNGESWKKSEFYQYIQSLGVQVISVDYEKYNRNDITSNKVQQIFTDAINQLPPDSKFDVVVHSMGGLLTRYYLWKHEEIRKRVRRVIFIGTPNHGSPVAFKIRLVDMVESPDSYWPHGKNDKRVQEYKKLYLTYAHALYDSYRGGKILSFESWLAANRPDVLQRIKDRQYEPAGIGLKIGVDVPDGGVPYRYSGAVEEYAKLLTGRYIARNELYDPDTGPVIQDTEGPDRDYIENSPINEITPLIGKGSAKNIVQDRLMYERFNLYTSPTPAADGSYRPEKIVANLFLHQMNLDEYRYRRVALQNHSYVPQYLTIATVDDPHKVTGRMATDPFIHGERFWDYEDHDSVVPVSSVTLKTSKGYSYILDRSEEIRDPYISHSDQMGATDILRRVYDNPLTGTNDLNVIMDMKFDGTASKTGRVTVLRPTNDSLGQDYPITVASSEKASVYLIKRDAFQTWSKMEEIPLLKSPGNKYEASYVIQPDEDVTDYLIVSTSPATTVTCNPDKWPNPTRYYIQPLRTDIVNGGSAVSHTFRVYDRVEDVPVGHLDAKDFVVRLNENNMFQFRLNKKGTIVKNDGNILLALDYSSSMEGYPVLESMAGAESYIRYLDGRTSAKVGVLGFSNQVHLLHDFTTDYEAASKSVYTEMSGDTALYDAIVMGSNLLGRQRGNRTLLLMTDGSDNKSTSTLEEAIQAARQNNVSIYIVCLGGEVNSDVLEKIAASTNGKVYYTFQVDSLSSLYQTITEEQDTIYTIEYELPDHLLDHNVSSIRLTTTGEPRSNTAAYEFSEQDVNVFRNLWQFFQKGQSR